MKLTRIIDPDAVRPLHAVMVCLVGATLAGNCLLTSGPFALLEGARDWAEESPVKAIVHVLNLNYTQTTARGVAIKWLVFGVGAGIAAISCGIALASRSRTGEEVTEDDRLIDKSAALSGVVALTQRQIPPLLAGQVLLSMYVVWSFASSLWSSAPAISLGGSTLLAMGVLWALALGRGLNRSSGAAAGFVLIAVLTVTSVVAIVYFGERNPLLRASYPMGNPLFLAACLIPGVLMCCSAFCGAIESFMRRRRAVHILMIVGCVAAVVAMLWTIKLTGARGAVLATAGGAAVLLFLAVPRRGKLPVAITLFVIAFAGLAFLWPRLTADSATGRDDSLRLRWYAWWYAVDLTEEAAWLGHGQGGFVRFGDALAADDVLADPLPLNARIAHAHNEWLETFADLGVIGAVMLVGGLGLTFWAGIGALWRLPNPVWRWMLIGLLASLAALVAEESASPGLRVAGLPAVFYTVVGLIWALCREPSVKVMGAWRRPAVRRLSGVASVAIGVILLAVSVGDFQAARAHYQVLPALQRGDFAKAVDLSTQATAYRLNPQRRLEALERLCSTHLFLAGEHQASSLQRYGRAQSADAAEAQRMLRLAIEDRSKSEGHIRDGLEALDKLVRQSPNYWNAGWLEFRLYQLRLAYAHADNDAALVESATRAAADALRGELKRRPYDPTVAIHYAETANEQLPLEEVFEIIARPLRYSTIPPEYSRFLAHLLDSVDFEGAFAPIWAGIRLSDDGTMSTDPYAPEKLRLAALIKFLRQNFSDALEVGSEAVPYYKSLPRDARTGWAACLTELADYQLFSDPSNAQVSAEYARRAMELQPHSTPGRQMVEAIRFRLVTYHLAADDEASARERLLELDAGMSEALLSRELSSHYAMLCRSFVHRSSAERPGRLTTWLDRAVALNETNELAWRLRAQIEFDQGNWSESTQSLIRALSYGADPNVVYAFVKMGLEEHPDAAEFAALETQLRTSLIGHGVPPGNVPSVEPSRLIETDVDR